MNFEEQIMSKDKYLCIVLHHIEVIVSIPSNIFLNTPSFENWGISLGCSPVLARAYSVTKHI